MTPPTSVLAVVFVDVVGSAALRQRLGDLHYAQRIDEHHGILRSVLSDFPSGEEIEVAGDGFLLAFRTPSDAVRFALAVRPRLQPTGLVDRFGVHLGEVVVHEGATHKELFSLTVDVCARVMSLADDGRILLTRAAFDSARQHIRDGELRWTSHGRYALKGIDDPVEVCEVSVPADGPRSPPTESEKARRADESVVVGWRPAPGQEVPGTPFVLERQLGAGAVGETWLAHHRTLKNLRVFKFCFDAAPLQSLRREVALFRVLQERVGAHPHIVRLHDVQLDRMPYYLATDYAEGHDLLGWWDERQGAVPVEQRLEIVAQIADALQAAHDAGVLHRDVKPTNILVDDRSGAVHARLADFGIGQVVSGDALAGLTEFGLQTILGQDASSGSGTRMYLAPEVLAGGPASPRSDLFALGVVLWQLVVGDLRRALVPDWERSVADPLIRDDLRQCFAGEPAERFVAAGQLARNLRALESRRGEAEAIQRAADRRALVRVGSVAAAAVTLFAALAGVAWTNRTEAQRLAVEERQQRIRVNLDAGSRAFIADEPLEALPYFAEVLRLVEGTDRERDARARLQSAFERVPRIVSMTRSEPWSDVDLSMLTGRIVDVGSKDGRINVWDASGKLRVAGNVLSPLQRLIVAWSRDGTTIAIASTVDVEIRRAEDLELLSEPLTGSGELSGIIQVWWSTDGNRIFAESSAHGGLRAYDVATAEAVEWRTPPDVEVLGLSPSGIIGQGVPSGNGLRALALYDVVTGRKIRDLFEVEPHGILYPRGSDSFIALWHTPGVVDIVPLAAPDLRQSLRHKGMVYDVAFSPDERLVATGSRDTTARVWDARTGNGVIPFLPHLHQVFAVSFPDDHYLMTKSADGLVRVWRLPPALNRRAGADAAIAVDASDRFALVPDGDDLSCEDLRAGRTIGRAAVGHPVQGAAFDASGRWASVDGALLDVESCRIVLEGEQGGIWNPVVPIFLGDSNTNKDFLWTPERGREPRPNSDSAAWSPDGEKVALADGASVAIWDPATGETRTIAEGSCYFVRWGPSIAAGCEDGVRLLDPDTGRLLRTFGETLVGVFAWSPDGRRLAVIDHDGLVKVWDIPSGARLAATTVPGRPVGFLGFTEDGRYVAGRIAPGALAVWNASTGELVTLTFGAGPPPTLTPSGIIVGLKIPDDDRSVADWLDIAELYSLQRVTDTGVDIPTPDRVYEIWRGLAERDPKDFRFDASAP